MTGAARTGAGPGRPSSVCPGRLLLVFAHPDDEAFFTAGTVARHVREGGEAALVCATPGDRGSQPDPPVCLPAELGRVRTAELRRACRTMGVGQLTLLGYGDGRLAEAAPEEAAGRIARVMARYRPSTVVTFGPEGIYRHPDHMAIHRFTLEAFRQAAPEGARLWYVALASAFWRHDAREPVGGAPESSASLGGEGTPAEAVIDIATTLETKMETLLCHRTQRHNVERAFGALYDFNRGTVAGPEARAFLEREYFTASPAAS